uniref:PPPDE domain-containing protein n=1 Tax=Neobodo designis TaxID=312471 RepID=A0A7S1QEH9_NEODS
MYTADSVAGSNARFREYVTNVFEDVPHNTVVLNIYDITWGNTILGPLGLGVHHTGVEVYGREYSFGRSTSGTGIFEVTPKKCSPHTFRESIVLGQTKMAPEAVRALVRTSAGDWIGTRYHIARNNCNIFSGFFANELLSADGPAMTEHPPLAVHQVFDGPRGLCAVLPAWVNRLADVGVRWAPSISDRVEAMDRDAR